MEIEVVYETQDKKRRNNNLKILPVPVGGVWLVTITADPPDPRAFKMTPKEDIRGSIITVFPEFCNYRRELDGE